MSGAVPLPRALHPPRLRAWVAVLVGVLLVDAVGVIRVFHGRIPFNYQYEITPENAERLHALMQDVHESWPDTRVFLEAMITIKFDIGIQGLPTLMEYTKHDSEVMRRVALGAIGSLQDTSATPAVLEAMHDPDSLVVFSACMTLGDLGDRRGLDDLRAALDHADYRVRTAAALNLAIVGPRAQDVEALIAHIEDPHDMVGATIQQALSDVCGVNPRFLGRSRVLWTEWWRTTGRDTVVLSAT